MKLNSYVSRIPGATAYTPTTQLRVTNSPEFAGLAPSRHLRGLGTATTTDAAGNIFDKAKQLVSDNPVPVLLLIGALILRR